MHISLAGAWPTVQPSVALVKGWFNETVPRILARPDVSGILGASGHVTLDGMKPEGGHCLRSHEVLRGIGPHVWMVTVKRKTILCCRAHGFAGFWAFAG